jgi:hypothetical protein
MTGMITGLALMRGQELGQINTEADYKAKEAEYKTAFAMPETPSATVGTPNSGIQPTGRTSTAAGAAKGSTTKSQTIGSGGGSTAKASPAALGIQSTASMGESMSRTPTPNNSRGRQYAPMGMGV